MIRAALMALLLPGCLPLSDLRPPEIDPEDPQQERVSQGRAQLLAAARAHGLDAWLAADRTELEMRDVWVGVGRWFNPWPDPDVTVTLVQHPGTFDSTATFQGGSLEGHTWGIERWSTYTVAPDGQRRDAPDPDIRFMLPTVQYFVDLPFRLLEAEIVRSVGEQQIGGEMYEVVYATWGSVEANREFDQYLVYLDPDTHRIEKVQYTVREMMPFAAGTCHLDDQREIDGIWVPHQMTVTAEPGDDPSEGWMHQMTITSLSLHDDDGESRALR